MAATKIQVIRDEIVNNKIKLFFLLLFIICIYYILTLNKNITFDKEIWKSKPSKRHLMIDDIFKNCRFIGMSREDIKINLGTECFKCNSDIDFYNDNDVNYIISEKVTGFNNYSNDALVVSFNKKNIVYELKYYKKYELIRICK